MCVPVREWIKAAPSHHVSPLFFSLGLVAVLEPIDTQIRWFDDNTREIAHLDGDAVADRSRTQSCWGHPCLAWADAQRPL